MSKVLTVASQKGGVAKTTTVLNMATVLSIKGRKVLCIDADPQGSLSICAGVSNPDTLPYTTYALMDAILDERALPEHNQYILSCGHIDIIPCNIKLAAIESSRSNEIGVQEALKTLIDPLRERYDVIIIDVGPSLGVLAANAIIACDGVIIPVSPQLLSAVGLKLLVTTIQKIKKFYNPAVNIEGVLMTMCDVRTNLYKDVSKIMETVYGSSLNIFNTVIPHSTKVGEANLNRCSILDYAPTSKAAIAYAEFANELIAMKIVD